MKGKHYIITGASSGLGEALALELSALGANLTIAARRLDRLEALRQKIYATNPKLSVLAVSCDVSKKADNEALVKKAAAHFGAIDGYIANAGKSMWTRFSDVKDPDELKDLMDLNYMGVVYGAFYALPLLRKKKGSFVAISSLQGSIPVPYHTGYVASKYAVNGFIDSLRFEEPELHLMLALPSWIAGTELREHAVVSEKKGAVKVQKSHNKTVISAKDCAHKIIDALKKRKTEIYIPEKYAYVPALRTLLKRTVDHIIKRKVESQLSDH